MMDDLSTTSNHTNASSKRNKGAAKSSTTTRTHIQRNPEVHFRPSKSVWFMTALLLFLRRKKLVLALLGSWFLLKASHAIVASRAFQSKFLLLQFTRAWPPCDLDKPGQAHRLPLLLRWIDWLPMQYCEDFKSFPGLANAQNVDELKKRKIGAWIIEPKSKKRKGIVLHFKGRIGHRGQRSRLRFYERITSDPLGLHCAAFDGPAEHEESMGERNALVASHAVWSALTKAPYGFEHDSLIIWGSTFGCCSAANLCLYLMRRGTPPAALVLENPSTSFPKLLASRFEFLGEHVQSRIHTFAKNNLLHRFDLEKRIRSICSLGGVNVPILVISAENDWTVPSSHAHRLAAIASALAASKRVLLLSLPISRHELLLDKRFVSVTSSFLHQALHDATQTPHIRNLSVDFGSSPATWVADQAAEDRLLDEAASTNPPFGL